MRDAYDAASSRASGSGQGTDAPTACPVCRSTSILTTAKSPDVESYWRCTDCGEVWNNARHTTARYAGRTWR